LWTLFLQHLLGLRDLGHDVFWLEVLRSNGDTSRDRRLIEGFFRRMREHGVDERCMLLVCDKGVAEPALASAEVYGASAQRVEEIARSADLVWNYACALRPPLLSLFKRRALVDGDPGHLQVSALSWDMGLRDHDAFLTAGGKLHDADCAVPTLGVTWHPFPQFVYLPMWDVAPDPGPQAPFTSVTQWNWGEIWLGKRPLSIAKRDAYLQYVALPRRAGRPFELAANIHPADQTGDRELLLDYGWTLVDPHEVAQTPAAYQAYIRSSRAELCCPKPIYRDLRTGWFSDRSACYLASGRPVLAEDTGSGDWLPTGHGLVAFRDEGEALAGVAEIDGNYAHHAQAARDLTEAYLDSRRCLPAMLATCG
jgi:hypothetical protein